MPELGPVIHHIPVCPFSQRLEILLELKGLRDRARFEVVDVTVERPGWLAAKLGGITALPVLETTDGAILNESLVILRYLDELFPEPPIARSTPLERAIENMLIAMEGPFGTTGYRFILNRERARRDPLRDEMLAHYRALDRFLSRHAPEGPFLFERFGLAEAVFTPLFMRFWFLDYYEGFEFPPAPEYARVRRWRDACLAHPAAQQVCYEQIVKLYYDYALGVGNGGLLEGRTRSSFVFEPDWRSRPMPPREKYGPSARDEELGLLAP
jgi:glutathione S-transferase